MSFSTALIRKESIEELCAHRERALECYRRSALALEDARKAHHDATKARLYGTTAPTLAFGGDRVSSIDTHNVDKFMERMTLAVDRDMWKAFIQGTPLGSLMDKEERERFEKSLNDNPPPATPDNVYATLLRLAGEADHIFRRGLVNAFSKLCRDYKSNDGFKIGERTVITWGAVYEKSINWFRFGHRSEEELQDIDRVMHVLDGKPAPEYRQGLCGALSGAMSDYRQGGSTVVETPYWRARFFKNGNIHLWILRKDLHDRANKIIAEWFGEVLGAGHSAKKGADPDWTATAGTYTAEDLGFFETPADVVADVIAEAELEPHHVVLEPSAGKGAIARKAAESCAAVDCIEIHADRVSALNQVPGLRKITQGDFLDATPSPVYDRVLMNPPFSKLQDIRHVMHAVRFLKPGGKLVAIMAAGVTYRQDKLATVFRDYLDRFGTLRELPDGAFKESGTNVRTVIVTLTKPRGVSAEIYRETDCFTV